MVNTMPIDQNLQWGNEPITETGWYWFLNLAANSYQPLIVYVCRGWSNELGVGDPNVGMRSIEDMCKGHVWCKMTQPDPDSAPVRGWDKYESPWVYKMYWSSW